MQGNWSGIVCGQLNVEKDLQIGEGLFMNKQAKVVRVSKKTGRNTRAQRAPIRTDPSHQVEPAGPLEPASAKIGHDTGGAGNGGDNMSGISS